MHQDTFEKHQLLAKVAMQQELNERLWQPPIRAIKHCPLCGSTNIAKAARSRDGKNRICGDCSSHFSEGNVPGCTCWLPGQLEKCLDCPHYRCIQKGAKARIEGSLQHMTVEEAQQLLATPSFYVDRQGLPPKEEDRDAEPASPETTGALGSNSESDGVQLTLL